MKRSALAVLTIAALLAGAASGAAGATSLPHPAVAGAGSTPAAQADATIRRGFDVSGAGTLRVSAAFGSIEVTSGGGNRVEVTVDREVRSRYENDASQILSEYAVDISQSGNDVTVRTDISDDARDRWRDDYRNTPLQVSFVISVPRAYSVDLETSGGSIEVADLDGDVRSETSGGSLRFGDISGSVWGRTSGGSITLDGTMGTADVHTSGGSITIGTAAGTVDAETSGGTIRIESAGGDVTAHTSGGSIEVNEVRGSIEASTSGGSVRATITEQPGGDCRLSTSGGSITVTLASGIAVAVDASSGGSGRVTSDFDVDGRVRRTSIDGTINGGGPQLHLRTSGGGIGIRRR